MSVGPLGGIPASAAGSPLAQTQGAEVDRSGEQNRAQHRRIRADQRAEDAAGIGQADGENHETAERDADGRRLWERPPEQQPAEQPPAFTEQTDRPRSKDPTGQCGNLLDLTG